MKTSTLVAILLVLGVCAWNIADAANGYQAPARWSKFRPATKTERIAQAPSGTNRSALIKGPPPETRQRRTPETIPLPPPSNAVRQPEPAEPPAADAAGNTVRQPGDVVPEIVPTPPGNAPSSPGTTAPSPDNLLWPDEDLASESDRGIAPPRPATTATPPTSPFAPPSSGPPAPSDPGTSPVTKPDSALAAPWSNALMPPGSATTTSETPAQESIPIPPPIDSGSTGKRQVVPSDNFGNANNGLLQDGSPQNGSLQNGSLPNGSTPMPSDSILDFGQGYPGQNYGTFSPGSQIVIPGTEGAIGPGNLTGIGGGPCEPGMPCPDECCPIRLPMKKCFFSSNLLVYSLSSSYGRRVATGLGYYTTNAVDPSSTVGIDFTVGRYLKCGLFGIGLTALLWDPGSDQETRVGTAGTLRADMPEYRWISVDAGAGAEPIYDIIEGSGAYAGATGIRIDRDMRMMGLELNLFSFGLMGARRISYLTPCPPPPDPCAGTGNCATGPCDGSCGGGPCDGPGVPSSFMGYQYGKRMHGYGGATGPLVRPECGRVRVITSHGFRWLFIDDAFEFAYNTDGVAGYQATDIFEVSEVENNLIGYQFGARLTYCLNSCLHFYVGGKYGIYSNSVRYRHRVGTGIATAYLNGSPTDLIATSTSDQNMATLGELDFGIGCRLGCAWTIRLGYRAFGVSGIATAVGSLPNNYATVASSAVATSKESLLLHGVSFGVDFNW